MHQRSEIAMMFSISLLFFAYVLSITSASSNQLARPPSTQRLLRSDIKNRNNAQSTCKQYDCGYGLWNKDSCECDCISPFCRSGNGDCIIPTGNCGGNPWENCERGENCPWWNNGSGSERCVTGNRIPPGVWDIYTSEEICCQANHPHSAYCESTPITSSPTKQPVASPKFEDIYEVITIKFNFIGTPDFFDKRDLKDEMVKILRRVLIDLANRISSLNLKIKSVEERPIAAQSIARARNQEEIYYDVTIVRQEDKQFGPTIENWIRDSFDDIIEQLQDYTTKKYIGMEIEWGSCPTAMDTEFRICSFQVSPVKARFQGNFLPKEELLQRLTDRLIEIYKGVLVQVDGLDITDIELANIVELPTGFVDVFFDIYAQNYREDIDVVISQTIEESQDDILGKIQGNFDVELCINQDGAYTVCEHDGVEIIVEPTEGIDVLADSSERFKLPLWAIILLAALGLLLCCAICSCINACMRRREEEKNDTNMVTYIHTGELHNGKREPRSGKKFARKSLPPPTLRSSRQKQKIGRRQPKKKARRNSYETVHSSRRSSRNSDGEQEVIALEAEDPILYLDDSPSSPELEFKNHRRRSSLDPEGEHVSVGGQLVLYDGDAR